MPLFDRLFRPARANRESLATAPPQVSAVGSSGSSSVSIDPLALMKIRNLEMRAKAVVDGFMSGIHRSPYHGFSVEFTDYRQYSPGDDVRYLDWKLYARQDRYYIKRFEDETNLRCYLIADLSRSMEFGSVGFTKADYARTLLATLGYFLSIQRDAVGLLTFEESIGEYLPPRYRAGHLRRLMLALERATSGKRTDIAPPLQQVTRLAKRRGLVVLASDFLAPIEGLDKQLGYLRSQGHEIIVVRILDPQEVEFDYDDPQIFEDMESGRQLFVDPASVRRTYQKNFRQHAEQLEEICRRQAISLVSMSTNRPLDEALLEFVRMRSSQKSRSRNLSVSHAFSAGGVA